MGISTMFMHAQPAVMTLPPGGLGHRVISTPPQKDKVVVVMGATGTGKSRLSIDLATRFPAEIINSDKMQVYEGLDIVTNKITQEEQRGVPHHLLGTEDPNSDFTAVNFCNMASAAIESILGRGRLPIIVGGSNSYVEALIDDDDYQFRSRYDCCFLWVDVAMPTLHSFVTKRVDEMVKRGMVEELRSFFDPGVDYSKGIRKAIGAPEFDQYFKYEEFVSKENREKLFQQAISEMKENNCKLACRQFEKINRLMYVKRWKMHRLDASQVFRKHGEEANTAWKKLVAEPSADIVHKFLSHFVLYSDNAGLDCQTWRLPLLQQSSSNVHIVKTREGHAPGLKILC